MSTDGKIADGLSWEDVDGLSWEDVDGLRWSRPDRLATEAASVLVPTTEVGAVSGLICEA